MKTFNLFQEIIVVPRSAFLQAVNASKPFAITYDGQIRFAPFGPETISIFEGSVPPPPALSALTSRPISSILGDEYRIVEDDDRILIKASGAWQKIIGWNRLRCLYDDTSGDGIAEFADKALETTGWHATEFHIPYRDIVDAIESSCEGLLLCIEQAEPYQFSGMGFVSDIEHARSVGYDFCSRLIQEKLRNDPEFSTLTDDEEEAAAYFAEPR